MTVHPLPPPTALEPARAAIREARHRDEAAVVAERVAACALSPDARAAIAARAAAMVGTLRSEAEPTLMEAMLAEYGLSTDEGIALMCLAEAYLRVPDAPTLDALIRDKIAGRDWLEHSGHDSLLINASSWGLMLTGSLYEPAGGAPSLVARMRSLVRRVGEPVVRAAVAQAMRILGQQFVLGRDIGEALDRATPLWGEGYSHSFDMLGEAARTAADAARYFKAYAGAIAAVGARARTDRPVLDNPGVSVKLSALHPRYEEPQRARVIAELVPRVLALAELAASHHIGLTIDAEEADRLELSLDVFAAVLADPNLAGWDGFGMVVQAYAKHALPVIGWLDGLTALTGRRVAVRLVKGAYWDAEIKAAQVQGLPAYPVFTRKAATDASYLACARALFATDGRLQPQFATHNAHTACAVLALAPPGAAFEFQRLHGMGESLHALLLRQHGRRCRIYAPVGVHEDLLAYLVRRLLENGANSSFVHQVMDKAVPAAAIARDPLAVLEAARPLANPRLPLPADLFGPERRNSAGWSLAHPPQVHALAAAMAPWRDAVWFAGPLIDGAPPPDAAADGPARPRPVTNPANRAEVVGRVVHAGPAEAERALAVALAAFPAWAARPVAERAALLDAIADAYEAATGELCALLTREAGKTRPDAIAEVREAVDFCRYYAARARDGLEGMPRGPFVCISPWNFPLAIFTGQIAAALVSGNTVVAKPAEQTPLIAARAVALMHAAGLPPAVLGLLPGDGPVVGAALTADPRVAGVCFTGSTDTARRIDRALAAHAAPDVPLIAETGGLNAMIVDSTALLEAAVRDITAAAFQSAGQRCSALRVLFVQEDIAAPLLAMLDGAVRELAVGDPWDPATDVGPVIDAAARADIETHCAALAAAGRRLFAHPMAGVPAGGDFVAPAAFTLDHFSQLEREVFGPVLHVIRFRAGEIDAVVEAINAAGYGLTMGLHSRLDDVADRVAARARVGNLYVNRNQIGAVVGVQPFGGEGLSGTGPKAGGPAYLGRFQRVPSPALPPILLLPPVPAATPALPDPSAAVVAQGLWAARSDRVAVLSAALAGLPEAARAIAEAALAEAAPLAAPPHDLPGPTGERNRLMHVARGVVACLGGGEAPEAAALVQAVRALAAGNAVVLAGAARAIAPALAGLGLPSGLVAVTDGPVEGLPGLALVASEAPSPALRQALAALPGPRVAVVGLADGVARFAGERVVSTDTTASGGNATLLTLGEG